MFEKITYPALLRRMLDRALESNKNLDSREGSLLWLAEAPAAVELQNLYIALDTVLQETFADTASRHYLILRAAERGLSPYPSTPAVVEMAIRPTTMELPLGTRFSIRELNYGITRALGEGRYEITCETPGQAGNDFSGATMIPIEYIPGLESCSPTSLLIPGEDEEDTEAFRHRYMLSLDAQAFGGNRADYLEKVNALNGVGAVKVYRCWNGDLNPASLRPPEDTEGWISGLSGAPAGVKEWLRAVYAAGSTGKLAVGGTVRLVILDSTYSVPTPTLVKAVQTDVDPIRNAGEGLGLAPIGHVVTVEGAVEEKVNLAMALTYQEGWTWEDVREYATSAVAGYLHELAQSWADQAEPITVRISQIESRLLGSTGILDITGTTINGSADNLVLGPDSIPALGTIQPREG